jgi:hypothetical protein
MLPVAGSNSAVSAAERAVNGMKIPSTVGVKGVLEERTAYSAPSTALGEAKAMCLKFCELPYNLNNRVTVLSTHWRKTWS